MRTRSNWPFHGKFQELIDAGTLRGEVVKNKRRTHALILADEKELLAAIESNGIANCFDLKQIEIAERLRPARPGDQSSPK